MSLILLYLFAEDILYKKHKYLAKWWYSKSFILFIVWWRSWFIKWEHHNFFIFVIFHLLEV